MPRTDRVARRPPSRRASAAAGSSGSARRKWTTAAASMIPPATSAIDLTGKPVDDHGRRRHGAQRTAGRCRSRSHSRAASAAPSSPSTGPRTTIVPDVGARTGEVGRPHPCVGAQLAHAGVGHRRAEVATGGEVRGSARSRSPPTTCRPRRRRPGADRCPAQPCARRADPRELVAAVDGRQLAGGEHPRDRRAHRAGSDVEQLGEPGGR